MTLTELHNYLGNLVHAQVSYSFYNIDVITTHSNFYQVIPRLCTKLSKYNKLFKFQRYLEKKRPVIDYLVLFDGSLLIGSASDFTDLKKVALELTTQNLLYKQQAVLAAQRSLLSITHVYQNWDTLSTHYPKLFI